MKNPSSAGVDEWVSNKVVIAGSHRTTMRNLTTRECGVIKGEEHKPRGKDRRREGAKEAKRVTSRSPWIQLHFRFTLVFFNDITYYIMWYVYIIHICVIYNIYVFTHIHIYNIYVIIYILIMLVEFSITYNWKRPNSNSSYWIKTSTFSMFSSICIFRQ